MTDLAQNAEYEEVFGPVSSYEGLVAGFSERDIRDYYIIQADGSLECPAHCGGWFSGQTDNATRLTSV